MLGLPQQIQNMLSTSMVTSIKSLLGKMKKDDGEIIKPGISFGSSNVQKSKKVSLIIKLSTEKKPCPNRQKNDRGI